MSCTQKLSFGEIGIRDILIDIDMH